MQRQRNRTGSNAASYHHQSEPPPQHTRTVHRPLHEKNAAKRKEEDRGRAISTFGADTDDDDLTLLGSQTFWFDGPLRVYDRKWPGQRVDNGDVCDHWIAPSTPLGGGLCFRAYSTGAQCRYAHNLAEMPQMYINDPARYEKYDTVVCGTKQKNG